MGYQKALTLTLIVRNQETFRVFVASMGKRNTKEKMIPTEKGKVKKFIALHKN